MKDNTCRKALLWLLLGAALTALTLIFPQIGFLEWFTMIPLMIGVYRLCDNSACTLRKAYGYGFLTVYVFYFFIYHWFVNLYPLDFVDLDKFSSAVVVAAGWLGLPILQAAVGGLIFVVFRLMAKSLMFERMPLLRPFAFASLWVIFEWSSTIGWTGVPWGRLALGQINMLPMLQSASLFGSYFVTWLLVAVNGLLAYLLLYRTRQVLCGSVAAVLFCSNLLYGSLSMLLNKNANENMMRVAVVQGNVNSHDKWGDEAWRKTREAYGELTRRAAEDGAALVVWPETALPYDLSWENEPRQFVCNLARECNVTLIVGALYYGEEDYNALFLVEPDGSFREEFYAKQHLVPFGEYVPMRDLIMTLIPPLANLSALDGDLAAGSDSALFETQWGALGSLICFDSIYEELTLDSVRDGAELLLISSNDSWFYDSAAVYQHLAQAQLRAIESGRDIARAANTGISAVITSKGELTVKIEPLTDGYRVADVEWRETPTLYTLIGNWFVYLSILFVAVTLAVGIYCKHRDGRPRFLRAIQG